MTLRYDDRSARFEAAVILASLEDSLPSLSSVEKLSSPLLDRHNSWVSSADPARRAETEHANPVVSAIKREIWRGMRKFKFSHAVRRLELLGTVQEREGLKKDLPVMSFMKTVFSGRS